MRVKYIGTNTKTDSINGVGLVWVPGQVRDVSSTVAEHLLACRDTWIKDESEASGNSSNGDADPVDILKPEQIPEEPLPVINFHAMDKDALVKFAADQYNEKFPKNIGEDVLRERVIKLFTKHEMENTPR